MGMFLPWVSEKGIEKLSKDNIKELVIEFLREKEIERVSKREDEKRINREIEHLEEKRKMIKKIIENGSDKNLSIFKDARKELKNTESELKELYKQKLAKIDKALEKLQKEK